MKRKISELYLFELNNRPLIYVHYELTELKEVDKFTMKEEIFITSFNSSNKNRGRQKISKNMDDQNSNKNEHTWKTTLHSTRRGFKLFSVAYGTVVEIGDMLGHRASCS